MDKPQILFVDDERQILVSLRALFRNDYRVFLANSGAEAIDIVRREQIDAIISDQRMPNMQGHELLRRIKKISPTTMRLLLTGYSDLSAIMNSINDGEIFRFIHKPWNNNELRALVQSAVKIARETRLSQEQIDEPKAFEIQPIDPEPLHARSSSPAATGIGARAAPPAPRIVDTVPASATRSIPPIAEHAPRAAPTPQPLQPPLAAEASPGNATDVSNVPEPRGPAILVLDDKLDTFTRLRGLYGNTHPVRIAHTLDKAVEILDEVEVGLLVTDVQLNGEDTTDFIKLLKQQYPIILTLVLTEVMDSELAIELINQGRIYRYLRKPIGDGTFKISINQGLRFYSAHKSRPELLRQQKTDNISKVRNASVSERLFGRLRALKRRFSFGF